MEKKHNKTRSGLPAGRFREEGRVRPRAERAKEQGSTFRFPRDFVVELEGTAESGINFTDGRLSIPLASILLRDGERKRERTREIERERTRCDAKLLAVAIRTLVPALPLSWNGKRLRSALPRPICRNWLVSGKTRQPLFPSSLQPAPFPDDEQPSLFFTETSMPSRRRPRLYDRVDLLGMERMEVVQLEAINATRYRLRSLL